MTNADIAYSDLRRALIATDLLTAGELVRLQVRVMQAANAYPDAPDTPAQNKENAVLRAYAAYVGAVMSEQAMQLSNTGTQ